MPAIMRAVEADHPLVIGNRVGRGAIGVVDGDALIHLGADVGEQGVDLAAHHIAPAVLPEIGVGLEGDVIVHHACPGSGQCGGCCHGGQEGAAKGEIQVKFHIFG